jgi:hypothetical protein
MVELHSNFTIDRTWKIRPVVKRSDADLGAEPRVKAVNSLSAFNVITCWHTAIARCQIWGPIFHEVEVDQDWGEVKVDAAVDSI